MLPQPDLLSVEEHLVASGRQVFPLVDATDLEPGDLLGVAHAPLMRVLVNPLQHSNRVTGPFSGPPALLQVSAVTDSPLAAAAATASRLPALLHRLTPS